MKEIRVLKKKFWQKQWNYRDLYLIILIPFVYVFIFNYIPMYGITLAFKNYQVLRGILGSPWIGFHHFERFFSSHLIHYITKNSLCKVRTRRRD